jgi:hypothetical protein
VCHAHVAFGSLSTEAADSAARPTSASPRKPTSGPYEKFRRDGPISDSRAAAKCNYSITSSARTRTDGGIFNPSALAALLLTTNSSLVGNSTGRSPGLAPLRILFT